MPAPTDPVNGDIFQAIIATEVDTQQCLNVLYYQLNGNPGVTYQAALDQLNVRLETDAVESVVIPMSEAMADNATIAWMQLQRVYPTRSYNMRYVVDLAGILVDQCDAPNLAAVVSKKSESAGRGRTGSFHLPGLPNTSYALGLLTAPQLVRMDKVAQAIRTQLTGPAATTTWDPGMFNPNLGTPANFNLIIGTQVQTAVRVVRRRTVGYGK